jgi:AbrB family looped-hinge helix DNA binding protein
LCVKSVVSSKGQITLPVAVREKLGLEAGTAVRFELCEGGVVIRKGQPGAHPVDQIFGTLTLGRPVDEVMDEMRGPRPTASSSPRRRGRRQR